MHYLPAAVLHNLCSLYEFVRLINLHNFVKCTSSIAYYMLLTKHVKTIPETEIQIFCSINLHPSHHILNLPQQRKCYYPGRQIIKIIMRTWNTHIQVVLSYTFIHFQMILHISSLFKMSCVHSQHKILRLLIFIQHTNNMTAQHIEHIEWLGELNICIPLAVAPTVYAGHVRDPIGNRLHCYTDKIIHLVRAFCFDKIFAFAPVCICCTSFTK